MVDSVHPSFNRIRTRVTSCKSKHEGGELGSEDHLSGVTVHQNLLPLSKSGEQRGRKRKRTFPEKSSLSSEVSVVAPDGGFGWVVVFAAFLVNMIADGVTFSIGVMFDEIQEDFKSSTAMTGGVVSLIHAVPLLTGPLAIWLTARYGCRIGTVVGSILASAGFLLAAFSNHILLLFLFFGIVTGFGLSLSYVASFIAVTHYFERKRSFAIGIAGAGSGVGTILFAPLIQYLLDTYSGWRGATIILSALFLIMAVCGMMFRELECTRRERLSRTSSSPSSTTGSQENCLYAFVTIPFTVFCISNFIIYFWFDVPYVYTIKYVEDVLKVSSWESTCILSTIGILNTVGEVLVGWLGDQPWMSSFVLYSVCMLVCGVVTSIIPLMSNYSYVLVLSALYGLFISANESLTSPLLVDLVGIDQFGSAYGCILACQGVGNLMGPPFAGWLYDITQTWELTFGMAGLCIGISGIILVVIPVINLVEDKLNKTKAKRKSITTSAVGV